MMFINKVAEKYREGTKSRRISRLHTALYVLISFILFFPLFETKAFSLNGTSNISIEVNEGQIIKRADKTLLGYNHEWLGSAKVIESNKNDGLDMAGDYFDMMRGFPMPLNRMSGTVSQSFRWKWAIGPLEDRKSQQLAEWDEMSKKRLGPVEWLKSVLQVDSDAQFTWTLNMLESPEDHADLAEFLTGDGKTNPNGGVNWAKKRMELGLKDPVKVVIWELGNEQDWKQFRKYFPTPHDYVEACKKAIDAVRKVRPEAKFAAHAATAPHEKSYHEKYGGWEVWHRVVLKEIGKDIDYIAFHSYYDGMKQAKLDEFFDTIHGDIIRITGEGRIKFYISEHARWPNHANKLRPWKDYWYKTHSLSGVFSTAEWMLRMMRRDDVAAAAYHSFSSGPWGVVYRDEETGRLYTTGIADLFKILNEAFGDNIVETKIPGSSADSGVAAAAMTSRDGVNVLMVNRSPYNKIKVSFKFKGRYKIFKETVLTADKMDDYNTLKEKKIRVLEKEDKNSKEDYSYTLPPKSFVVLYWQGCED